MIFITASFSSKVIKTNTISRRSLPNLGIHMPIEVIRKQILIHHGNDTGLYKCEILESFVKCC